MPHVAGHEEEFIPLDFSDEQDTGFIPLDFGVGQGRTQQQYVPDNNSIVNVPTGSSASLASRESKELIEGQEGLYGNTIMEGLLGAPGGISGPGDFRKLVGGLESAIVDLIAGSSRELVTLGLDVQPGIPFKTKSGEIITIPPFTSSLDRFIQEHPEEARRFSGKMLELQRANEDFLIRNELMFGPDDEPTILGNLLFQVGPTAFAIGLSVLLKSPAVAALFFGGMQQVSGFEEAIEAGKEPSTALDIGNVQGLIEGAISFIGLGIITGAIKKRGKSILSKMATGFITEGIEEGVTELLIIGVQNVTGVRDMTLNDALIAIFQAVFYGSLAGGGTTGTIAVVQRITDGSLSQEDTAKVARVADNVVADETGEIADQVADQVDVELQIDRDLASDQPVTKAAKRAGEQQKRVIEIMEAVNKGEDINIQALMDEIFPEARIQREKQRLEQARTGRARTITKQAVREAVVDLQARIQIAEQQGNEEEAARLFEEIVRIQQISFGSANLREAVEELEAEGVFVRGSELLNRAVAEIDDLLRPLRAGVRVGRVLQKEETTALQDSLTQIVRRLKGIVDPDVQRRLQEKVRAANTVKSAERIRRDIISLARKSAFRKFISERRKAIDKTIKKNTDPKIGELDADSQNALDSLNKMRLGMESAVKVKDLPPVKERSAEEKKQATQTRQEQVTDFNIKQSNRIQKEMGQGIPTEGVILQVRYLDILNEKSKVTPNALALFEDDLNAFIETGKGVATAAKAEDQKLIDATRKQGLSNEIPDSRADIENSRLVEADEAVDLFLRTHETALRILGLKGTVFDLFKEEVSWRNEKQLRTIEMEALADRVSPDGKAYLRELSNQGILAGNVIDVPREKHTAELGGKQSSRIKMTRGQLVYARMLLEEKSIEEQIRNPKGSMAWTDKFVGMINERLTDEDRAFIQGLFEIYARSYERLNEAYRDIYNRDLTRVEFYSHISREGKDRQELSAHTETVLIDMLAIEGTKGSLIFPPREPSVTKSRVDASSEIKIVNVVAAFKSYNQDAEHFIALGKKLSLQDKLLREKEFTNHLRELLSPGGFENFIQHVKIIARSNDNSKEMDRTLRKVFEFFRRNFFKKTLLANPKIGLGQTATALAAMSEMPSADFFAGAKDYIENPKKANEILNEHPSFKNRELNFNPEIEQVGGFGTVLHFLNLSSRKGDGFGARVSGRAIVKFLMEKKGVSKKDALDEAAEFVERSQQSTLLTQRTLAQKSDDPLIRTLTMFTSSPTAMLNVSMQAIIKYKQADTSTPKRKAAARQKLRKTLAVQNLYIPALYAVLTGRGTATIAGGSLGGVSLIGGILTVIAEIMLNIFREEDERVFTEGPLGEIALSEAITDILEAAELLTEEDVSLVEYIEASIPIVEAFTGAPIDNVMDIAKGAMELFDTDDPLDAILQMGNYGDAARKRTLERLDAIPGVDIDTGPDSDRILTQGAF